MAVVVTTSSAAARGRSVEEEDDEEPFVLEAGAGVCLRCNDLKKLLRFPGCEHLVCAACYSRCVAMRGIVCVPRVVNSARSWAEEGIPERKATDVYSLRCFAESCEFRRRVPLKQRSICHAMVGDLGDCARART